MKRSTTINHATSQPPLRAGKELLGACHNEVLSDPTSNVTLNDIYKKLAELLSEIATQKAIRKAIRLPDVKDLTGESRSQIYARMNPKYSAYDATWPTPFYIGKSPRWWLHEVMSWLEAQAAATTIRH
jgi:predicted DNA-binding transcriptional regulator AlpA